jgi:hypothetical protein
MRVALSTNHLVGSPAPEGDGLGPGHVVDPEGSDRGSSASKSVVEDVEGESEGESTELGEGARGRSAPRTSLGIDWLKSRASRKGSVKLVSIWKSRKN